MADRTFKLDFGGTPEYERCVDPLLGARRRADAPGRGGLGQVAGLSEVVEEPAAGGWAELAWGVGHAPNSLARARARLPFGPGGALRRTDLTMRSVTRGWLHPAARLRYGCD